MPPDLVSRWDIDLASWVIQDGNYTDFCVGDLATFALECHGTVHTGEEDHKAVRRIGGERRYEIQGQVLYRAADVWVVDFGIRAYCERGLSDGVEPGSFVVGEIDLGIDYYVYKEFLHMRPGFPELGYAWRIDRILQVSAPYIPTTTPWGAPARMRDMASASYTAIERTNAWEDEDGHAEYILQCTLLDPRPNL